MGRYFKAQPVELNRDFIYQPPLELMAKALLKKDDDIQQQADTMELIRSLPIDFIDYHKEGAANIKNEINSDIDNFAKEIQGKAALDGSLKAKLNAYKNKLQERYSTGDIYNIQETAKNYREFEKKLEANKSLTSAQKEDHKNTYWKNYTNENPEGAYKSVYTPGPIVDDADFAGEMNKWIKTLPADKVKTVTEKLGGRYDKMTTTERNNFILENGHELFLESRPDLKELLIQQGKSGVYNNRDIKFNKDGSLNYKEGFLGNLGKVAKEMNYIDTLDSTTYDTNDYTFRQEEWNRAEQAEKAAALAEVSKDVSIAYTVSTEARNEEQKVVDYISSKLIDPRTKKPYQLNNIDHAIKVLELANSKTNSTTLKEQLQLARDTKANTKASMVASWKPVYDLGYTEKDIDRMKENIKLSLINSGYNFRYNIAPMKSINEKGKSTVLHTKTEYQNINPKNLINKYTTLPFSDKKVLITNIAPIADSFIPIIKNKNNLNNNEASVVLKYTYIDDTGTEKSFTKEALMDMNQLKPDTNN